MAVSLRFVYIYICSLPVNVWNCLWKNTTKIWRKCCYTSTGRPCLVVEQQRSGYPPQLPPTTPELSGSKLFLQFFYRLEMVSNGKKCKKNCQVYIWELIFSNTFSAFFKNIFGWFLPALNKTTNKNYFFKCVFPILYLLLTASVMKTVH